MAQPFFVVTPMSEPYPLIPKYASRQLGFTCVHSSSGFGLSVFFKPTFNCGIFTCDISRPIFVLLLCNQLLYNRNPPKNMKCCSLNDPNSGHIVTGKQIGRAHV